MATDGREGRFDDGVRDDPDLSRVLAATQATGEGAQLGLDLSPEPLGPPAHGRWPSAVDEVISAVEQQQPSLIRVLAGSLRHVERRRKTGLPGHWARQPREERVLEGGGRTQPYLGQQDVPGVEAVVDGTRRRPHGTRDRADRRAGGPTGGDQPSGGRHDLILVELRSARHG